MTDAATTPGQQAPNGGDPGTTSDPTSAGSQATGVELGQTTGQTGGQQSGSAGQDAGNTSGSDVWAGLTPDNLNFVKGKNFADLNAQVQSHRELQTAFSQRSAAVDVPADVTGYDWAVPENAEAIGYNADFANAYKQAALEGKVPKAAAKHVHDWFVNYAAEARAQETEATNRAIAESKVTLTREWGPETGEKFTRNVELATRAVEHLKLGDHLVKSGALIKHADGKMTVVDAATVMAFAQIGQAMFSEDNLYGASAQNANPFSKDSENAAAQAAIYRENPHRALALIKASGQPEKFQYLVSRLDKQGVR